MPRCVETIEVTKATDFLAAQYTNGARGAPVAPHQALKRKHTGSSAMLAEKPLPGRNASYTYETYAALIVELPLQKVTITAKAE